MKDEMGSMIRGVARACFGLGIVWAINYQMVPDLSRFIFIAMISFGAMFGWD